MVEAIASWATIPVLDAFSLLDNPSQLQLYEHRLYTGIGFQHGLTVAMRMSFLSNDAN